MHSLLTTYLIGVGVSLCFTVARYTYAFLTRTFSTLHANLRKTGVRQSYLTGDWIRTGSASEELPLAIAGSAVLVLASWLGVVLPLVGMILSWWRRWTMPPRMKEILWRASHVNLDAKEVERLNFELLELTYGAEEAARQRAALAERKADREADGRNPS